MSSAVVWQMARFQQAGKILPEGNRDSQLVNGIAQRIIKAVGAPVRLVRP